MNTRIYLLAACGALILPFTLQAQQHKHKEREHAGRPEQAQAMHAFKQLDANDDGVVSEKEFRKHHNKMKDKMGRKDRSRRLDRNDQKCRKDWNGRKERKDGKGMCCKDKSRKKNKDVRRNNISEEEFQRLHRKMHKNMSRRHNR
ncbi:MAG: hypothetical protein ACLFUF_08375 [Opitutales bacterium]